MSFAQLWTFEGRITNYVWELINQCQMELSKRLRLGHASTWNPACSILLIYSHSPKNPPNNACRADSWIQLLFKSRRKSKNGITSKRKVKATCRSTSKPSDRERNIFSHLVLGLCPQHNGHPIRQNQTGRKLKESYLAHWNSPTKNQIIWRAAVDKQGVCSGRIPAQPDWPGTRKTLTKYSPAIWR